VPDGKAPAHALDQPPEQCQQIVFHIAEHLELVAGGQIVPDLERIERDLLPQQADSEVERVRLASAVGRHHRIEAHVVEML
jgi:hypothetical protein